MFCVKTDHERGTKENWYALVLAKGWRRSEAFDERRLVGDLRR